MPGLGQKVDYWSKDESSSKNIENWNLECANSLESETTRLLDLFLEEMKPYECDIIGIAEMHWIGTGEIGGGEVIWSGKDKDHERGVGFLLSKKARGCLLGYKPICPRIIVARFSGQPFNITVI